MTFGSLDMTLANHLMLNINIDGFYWSGLDDYVYNYNLIRTNFNYSNLDIPVRLGPAFNEKGELLREGEGYLFGTYLTEEFLNKISNKPTFKISLRDALNTLDCEIRSIVQEMLHTPFNSDD